RGTMATGAAEGSGAGGGTGAEGALRGLKGLSSAASSSPFRLATSGPGWPWQKKALPGSPQEKEKTSDRSGTAHTLSLTKARGGAPSRSEPQTGTGTDLANLAARDARRAARPRRGANPNPQPGTNRCCL